MIAYILLGVFTLLLIIGQIKNAEDGTCDTTLQCAVGFITLSVVWTRNIKE